MSIFALGFFASIEEEFELELDGRDVGTAGATAADIILPAIGLVYSLNKKRAKDPWSRVKKNVKPGRKDESQAGKRKIKK